MLSRRRVPIQRIVNRCGSKQLYLAGVRGPASSSLVFRPPAVALQSVISLQPAVTSMAYIASIRSSRSTSIICSSPSFGPAMTRMMAPVGIVIQPCRTTESRAMAGLVSLNRLPLNIQASFPLEENESPLTRCFSGDPSRSGNRIIATLDHKYQGFPNLEFIRHSPPLISASTR